MDPPTFHILKVVRNAKAKHTKSRYYIMNEISLNKEEFKLFDQDDQFGFFHDEDGWPTENAAAEFISNVDKLYGKYDYIAVDFQDNIHGIKNGGKELVMGNVMEAYEIAEEVKGQ